MDCLQIGDWKAALKITDSNTENEENHLEKSNETFLNCIIKQEIINENSFRCKCCDQEFSSAQMLKIHIVLSHEESEIGEKTNLKKQSKIKLSSYSLAERSTDRNSGDKERDNIMIDKELSLIDSSEEWETSSNTNIEINVSENNKKDLIQNPYWQASIYQKEKPD